MAAAKWNMDQSLKWLEAATTVSLGLCVVVKDVEYSDCCQWLYRVCG